MPGTSDSEPTPCASLPRRAGTIASGTVLLLLFLLVQVSSALAQAQESTPQFNDLASRAAAARNQNNLPQAIELYRQAEQINPNWAEGWFYLGLLQYLTNDFQQAIEAFNHLLALDPRSPQAVALRGLCEFETGAYQDALRDLGQSVQMGAANVPGNEQIIRFHLAELLTRAGRFQEALRQYEILAENHAEGADVVLGTALAGMKVASLPKDIPPENTELYSAAGSAGYAFLSGDLQRADTLFNQTFARYPTTPGLHFFYGMLFFTHSIDLDIFQFQQEVSIDPTNAEAHALLSFSLILDGRYSEARPEAEKAYAEAPAMHLAQVALGRSLSETGDPDRATEILNKILKDTPNDLEAHMALAVAYDHSGKREDAYRERTLCLSLRK